MFYYKVFIWWNDNTSSEFYTNANTCGDAENDILNELSGTMRDKVLSYYAEMVEKDVPETTSQLFDTYDEFDLALALYHWLQHNWEGQSDPLYEAFCTLTVPGMYHPAHSETVFENLANTDDGYAAEIYEMLTRDNYELALNRVLNYESKG